MISAALRPRRNCEPFRATWVSVHGEARAQGDDMSRGYPSMTALLALLAMAGYQNRDKLSEWIGGMQRSPGGSAPLPRGGSGVLPGNLGGILGGTSLGELLSGGLRDLVNAFKQNGQGEVADSWIGRGPNKQIAPSQLEQAIGSDVLADLSEKTGLSREEILSKLSKTLPDAVDKYTPDGQIPAAGDFART
jgi:uncharacterized protein YidB (DUF937 family)